MDNGHASRMDSLPEQGAEASRWGVIDKLSIPTHQIRLRSGIDSYFLGRVILDEWNIKTAVLAIPVQRAATREHPPPAGVWAAQS
jgi:hypothetical protein